mmetsp:Transcript_33962/g.58035  ORF Transcript_33962/g.58035 Transcript_33962/m.58035 type:complete len:183 (-) Transcript_33962:92-640(-)
MLIVTQNIPQRQQMVDLLSPGFAYLESRIDGSCEAIYSCEHMYKLLRVVQAFDPSFAATSLTAAMVDELSIVKPIAGHGLTAALKAELPAYLTAAQSCPGFDRSDIPLYTEQVLKWWRVNNPCFPTWAVAARMVFSMSPNSASCERVFSLLKQMFGLDQKAALADYLQAALMLRFNKRVARG